LAEDGWQHVIVSNHVPELHTIVDALGLAAYFKGVVSSAIVGFEKPNPRIFQHALQMTAPDLPVWMIGDNVTADCLSVGSFGIRAILVRNETAEFAPRARDLYTASAVIRAGGLPSTTSA
jgi:putative hydrolase of the HAD superfamily